MVTASDPRPLVVHVLHHLVVGGMENGLVNLINHMPQDQWRHRVLCIEDYSDFKQRIQRDDVEVLALHRSRIGLWDLRRRILNLCRQWRPAIVHTRNPSGLDALLPARLAGTPVCVHSEHGWDVDNLDGKRLKPILLRKAHSIFVDRYIAVSKDLERFLVRQVGIAASRVTQIYNGVDVGRFRPTVEKRSTRLPAGFRDQGTLLFGAVGRLQPVKDHATLLRAFAALSDALPAMASKLRLVIVGDGPMRSELQSLASSLGLSGRTWFAGSVDDVPELLVCFDLFVLPSLMEGTSNTVLEAMASGVAVLATGVGGNVELVRPGIWGDLFAPGDSAELARLMQRYADQPALAVLQGAAGRAQALAEFSLQSMVRRYGDVYSAAIAAKSMPSR